MRAVASKLVNPLGAAKCWSLEANLLSNIYDPCRATIEEMLIASNLPTMRLTLAMIECGWALGAHPESRSGDATSSTKTPHIVHPPLARHDRFGGCRYLCPFAGRLPVRLIRPLPPTPCILHCGYARLCECTLLAVVLPSSWFFVCLAEWAGLYQSTSSPDMADGDTLLLGTLL